MMMKYAFTHNAYKKMLTGKTKGKRSLGRPLYRWKDNIKRDHKELSIDSAQDWHYWRAFGM